MTTKKINKFFKAAAGTLIGGLTMWAVIDKSQDIKNPKADYLEIPGVYSGFVLKACSKHGMKGEGIYAYKLDETPLFFDKSVLTPGTEITKDSTFVRTLVVD